MGIKKGGLIFVLNFDGRKTKVGPLVMELIVDSIKFATEIPR